MSKQSVACITADRVWVGIPPCGSCTILVLLSGSRGTGVSVLLLHQPNCQVPPCKKLSSHCAQTFSIMRASSASPVGWTGGTHCSVSFCGRFRLLPDGLVFRGPTAHISRRCGGGSPAPAPSSSLFASWAAPVAVAVWHAAQDWILSLSRLHPARPAALGVCNPEWVHLPNLSVCVLCGRNTRSVAHVAFQLPVFPRQPTIHSG